MMAVEILFLHVLVSGELKIWISFQYQKIILGGILEIKAMTCMFLSETQVQGPKKHMTIAAMQYHHH